MKTASVRELRQNFGSLLAWLEEGQEIQITMRRRVGGATGSRPAEIDA